MNAHDILPSRTYQRIVRDGVQIRHGAIDTHAKFAAMFGNVSLKGKSVLDVGCNMGEMTRLIKDAGASYVLGIDKDPEAVRVARLLNPGIGFTVSTLEGAVGRRWDLVVCSAVLHYMPSLADAFRTLARLGAGVIGDACLSTDFNHMPMMTLHDSRRLVYPNAPMFQQLAQPYWSEIFIGNPSPSPDESHRRFFALSGRMPDAVPAKIIWGPGGAGKTTMARDLESGQGYRHMQTDAIFLEWRQRNPGTLSNMDFVDDIWRNGRGVPDYLRFHQDYIQRWLSRHEGLPVVIEGYDLCHAAYRELVMGRLMESGYCSVDVQQIALPRRAN